MMLPFDDSAERIAWRTYVDYVTTRAGGNRRSIATVFLGDDLSHELWHAWVVLWRPIVAARQWHRRYERDGAHADQPRE